MQTRSAKSVDDLFKNVLHRNNLNYWKGKWWVQDLLKLPKKADTDTYRNIGIYEKLVRYIGSAANSMRRRGLRSLPLLMHSTWYRNIIRKDNFFLLYKLILEKVKVENSISRWYIYTNCRKKEVTTLVE